MKKLLVALTALGIAASLCACGSATYTSTTTTTVTDADGNSTTTTTVSQNKYPEGSCGELSLDGEEHEIKVSFENETGDDITGLYITQAGGTEWSNLFDENEYLGDGETVEDYVTITYTEDTLSYDIGIKDSNGEMHEYDDVDISDLDPNGFTITFTNTDDGYGWTIDHSFVK